MLFKLLLFSKIVCPDEWMIAGAVAAEVEAARGEFDDDVLCEEAAAPRLIIYFFLTLVLTNNYIIIVRVDECEFSKSR